jgi:transcriptional regulator with GAF, ATPase, and Fis domain
MSGGRIGKTADSSAGPAHAARLTETFVELADTLVDDFDLIEFLYTLVHRCVELVDVSAVGLMIGDGRGRLQVMASSTEETRLLELFQLQNGEGPCLQCFRTGQPVEDPDLVLAADRWPLFAPEAVRAGFRTVHALPMRLRTQTIGALNLFHVRADALADADIRIAQALVDIATIGLIQLDLGRRRDVLLDQLETALDLRIAVEQAKGMVAQILGITPTDAFGVLRRYAAEHHHRLTELVEAVIERNPLADGLFTTQTTA